MEKACIIPTDSPAIYRFSANAGRDKSSCRRHIKIRPTYSGPNPVSSTSNQHQYFDLIASWLLLDYFGNLNPFLRYTSPHKVVCNRLTLLSLHNNLQPLLTRPRNLIGGNCLKRPSFRNKNCNVNMVGKNLAMVRPLPKVRSKWFRNHHYQIAIKSLMGQYRCADNGQSQPDVLTHRRRTDLKQSLRISFWNCQPYRPHRSPGKVQNP